MALHTYVENYNRISNIFTLNALSISRDPKRVDPPNMQMALCNGDKNHCYRTGGAYTGPQEEENSQYEYTRKYVDSVHFSDDSLGNLIPDGVIFMKEIAGVYNLFGMEMPSRTEWYGEF